MSRDYGKVRAQFWESDSIREMSVPSKFLGLYLLTSPHTNAIGCFRLPIAYICHDTGLQGADLEAALLELRQVKFALPCERVPWVYIPNYLRHNPPENPNVWRKCVKELESLPSGVVAAAQIAAELYAMSFEPRMCKPGSKTTVSDEERNKLKPYLNGIETVSEGSTPLSLPIPIPIPNHNLPAEAGDVRDLGFEDFWDSYDPPKNARKPEALKAWTETEGRRPALQQLLRAVEGYNAWLVEEGKRQKRQHPKQNPETWLRGEVWNGYMSKYGNLKVPDIDELRSAWDGDAGKLIDALGEKGAEKFDTWFARARFDRDSKKLWVDKPFCRNYIRENFASALTAAFKHEVQVEVAA